MKTYGRLLQRLKTDIGRKQVLEIRISVEESSPTFDPDLEADAYELGREPVLLRELQREFPGVPITLNAPQTTFRFTGSSAGG